jgi:hypothetical protein
VPRLEVPEDRTVLSTLTVLNTLDRGPGSLRDTIAAAGRGDTSACDPSLAGQTITLTGGELAITKRLDIEGVTFRKCPIASRSWPRASAVPSRGERMGRTKAVPSPHLLTPWPEQYRPRPICR